VVVQPSPSRHHWLFHRTIVSVSGVQLAEGKEDQRMVNAAQTEALACAVTEGFVGAIATGGAHHR